MAFQVTGNCNSSQLFIFREFETIKTNILLSHIEIITSQFLHSEIK